MSIRAFAAPLAALVLLPLVASATVVLAESFEQLTANSHLVVRGIAGSSSVRWDDAGGRINTWTAIDVREVLKGKLAGPVLIRQAGGVIGKVGQSVSGEASFKEGEEVIVFLEHPGDDQNIYVVRSMSFGKVTLAPSPLNERRAYRDGKGLGVYAPAEGSNIRVLNGREDLGNAESFVSRIKRAAKGAR